MTGTIEGEAFDTLDTPRRPRIELLEERLAKAQLACREALELWYQMPGCDVPGCVVCRNNDRVRSLLEAAARP
jgi:hypothetical protein